MVPVEEIEGKEADSSSSSKNGGKDLYDAPSTCSSENQGKEADLSSSENEGKEEDLWSNSKNAGKVVDSPSSSEHQGEEADPTPTTSSCETTDGKSGLPTPVAERLKAIALQCLHMMIFSTCIMCTWLILGFRWVLSLFLSGAPSTRKLKRNMAKLSWEQLMAAKDPVQLTKEVLPVPPPFPVPSGDDFTITFGPCANLMIYTGGVASCLRRCPNFAEVVPKLRFSGNSCGAFVAAVMAADVDMIEMLPEMLSWTERYRGRLWGLVGAYSASIASIVWSIFSRPECFDSARNRLCIGITAFNPLPGKVAVSDFSCPEELVTTLLGSCYIPVAFEVPQWSSKHGPLWDGAIFDFASQGDVVVSPYEASFPEVGPEEAYPKSFSFFPPHEADAIALFEDGYMDCLRWLQNGAPSRKSEREAAVPHGTTATSGSIRPLIAEGMRVLLEMVRGPDWMGPSKTT
eukprot:TRINITY_DN32707_c0_g1_i1.p1 TRINITY_DN32707_c0_g1~~TRINITY_DN32707_c0_g1_i1.p1  ORF type:complete len:477 (-),score=72.00 TRINITY_DN32707_c0_g1_i1:23-1399(-)